MISSMSFIQKTAQQITKTNFSIYNRNQYQDIEVDDTYYIHTLSINKPNTNIQFLTPQKLEAVFICATLSEIKDPNFNIFVKNMLSSINSKQEELDCVLVLNTYNNSVKEEIESFIESASAKFQNVQIVNANIHPIDDIYNRLNSIKNIPKYGSASGPNLMFLTAVDYAKKYNTIILLETDCIFRNDWIVACTNYVKYTSIFLISGATYDGNIPIPFDNKNMFYHINGVAFYKTGDPIFSNLIAHLNSYILENVPNDGIVSHDVAITSLLFNKLSSDNKNSVLWRYIYRHIFKNTLIINASLNEDRNVEPSVYYTKFQSCVILHKKKGMNFSFNRPRISVQKS